MTIHDQTSGLAWLPDSSMLVSSMRNRHVLRRNPDGRLSIYADLSDATPFLINDILLAPNGCLYVGDFGYHLYEGEPFNPGSLYRVDPDGAIAVAASGLDFPNTAAILPGSRTLVVPETFAGRVTAFDMDSSGGLTNRRTWANLPDGTRIDGCCVDAAGALWLASLWDSDFIRVEEGGTVTDVVSVPGHVAVDCRLGGADGRSLYLGTADDVMPEVTLGTQAGRISVARVDVPSAL